MTRILVVKMWALGDILMATPLLRALKRRWPDSEITWLADQDYAGILQDNPLLTEVIAFDSGTWRRFWRYGQLWAYWRMSQALRRDLRRRRFDIVINLTAEKWWSVWFNVASLRVGLFPRAEPGRMGRFYTHSIARADQDLVHNTQHYLRPALALGIPGPYDERLVLGGSLETRQAVFRFLRGQTDGEEERPYIVLHPGTSQDSKCWPAENYAALAAMLQNQYNDSYRVVLTGSPREQTLCEDIRDGMPPGTAPPLIAAGKLADLRQTVALVEGAAAVVTGDTSVLHIASALGTPLVAIYGSTRPGDNRPQFGPQRLLFDDTVPCAPCYKAECPLRGVEYLRCQRAVTPASALAALQSLLETTNLDRTTPGHPRPALRQP